MKSNTLNRLIKISLILFLTFNVNAHAALVIDGVQIVYNLSAQNDVNNATSTVEITITQDGVTQIINPVVGQQYEFVLKEGDSFRQDVMASASSGETPLDAGTNSITGGFSVRAIYEDTNTNPLAGFSFSELTKTTLVLFGEADSDGIDAVSQVNLNTLPFTTAIDEVFLLARSATRGSGLEDNEDFIPLSTFGETVTTDEELSLLFFDVMNDEEEEIVTLLDAFTTINNSATRSTSSTLSTISFEISTPVPLPATAWFLLSGLIGLVWKGLKANQPTS